MYLFIQKRKVIFNMHLVKETTGSFLIMKKKYCVLGVWIKNISEHLVSQKYIKFYLMLKLDSKVNTKQQPLIAK